MQTTGQSARLERIHTEITHTLNLPEHTRKSFFEHAVVTKYIICVHLGVAGAKPRLEWQVARRYSHFRANHVALAAMFTQRLPSLPPKQLRTGAPNPNVVAQRMMALDVYLRKMLEVPGIASCTQMLTFLGAYKGMTSSWFAQLHWRTGIGSEDGGAEEQLRGAEDAIDPGPATIDEGPGFQDNRTSQAAESIVDSMTFPIFVESFHEQFDQLDFPTHPDAAAAMTHRFLNGLEAAAAVDSIFGCTDEVLWCVRERLEDRLMTMLHPQAPHAGPGPRGDSIFCA